MRTTLPLILATLMAAQLSGCALLETATGEFSIQGDGNDFRLVACEQVRGETISMQYRSSSISRWSTFLDYEGNPIVLGPGDVIGSSDTRLEIVDPPDLVPGSQLAIAFYGEVDSSDYDGNGDFVVPEEGLPKSDWLRSDGSVGPDPCPKEPK